MANPFSLGLGLPILKRWALSLIFLLYRQGRPWLLPGTLLPGLLPYLSFSNSSFSSQTRGWIWRPKSSYIKHCCHFLCYRLLSVRKSIKRLNSIYLSGLAELLAWGDWRIFWFKLWTKANSFLYCTLIDISLRWFNSSWVVNKNKSWNTFKLKATGSVILYSISFYSRVTGFPFEQTKKKKKPTER